MTPGFHTMTAAEYHADPCPAPSLSSGVARTLATQSPAHAYLEHIRLGGHKSEPTAEMILGSYVHGLAANDLTEFEIGFHDNYTTKAAKEWRDLTKALGKTPVLEKTADRAQLIFKALREKAPLGVTRNPFETGKPEVTAIWQEEEFWFRARYDRLDMDDAAFADVWDWKTISSVTNDAITRSILDKGYHIQAAHYLRGIEKLAPQYRGRSSFIFAFVETEAPFAVRRVCLSEGFLSLGRSQLERAIATWKQCLSASQWPEWPSSTITLEPPAWYSMRVAEDVA